MVDYSNEFEVIKCYHPPTYKIQVWWTIFLAFTH
jgi:hypothetical protein